MAFDVCVGCVCGGGGVYRNGKHAGVQCGQVGRVDNMVIFFHLEWRDLGGFGGNCLIGLTAQYEVHGCARGEVHGCTW